MKLNKFYPTVINFGANTIYVFSFLILILNFFSGIVGGLWLLFVGGWGLVVSGIIMSIFMPYGWSIAFLLQLILAPFLTKAAEKGNKFWVAILGFIANFYGNFLIVLWTYFAFNFFMDYRTEYSLLPLLLLGYSVALGPLQYMAQKEGPDSSGSFLGVFLAQLGYIVLSIVVLAGGIPSFTILVLIALTFSLIIAIIAAISIKPAVSTVEEELSLIDNCPKCGFDKAEGDRFCTNCGHKYFNN